MNPTNEQIEMVHYRLDIQTITKPKKLVSVIAETVARLPTDVQEFVYANMQFFSGHSSVVTIDQLERDKKSVTILSPNARRFAVAHEIAHAYLVHCENPSETLEQAKQEEKEANHQARKWLA